MQFTITFPYWTHFEFGPVRETRIARTPRGLRTRVTGDMIIKHFIHLGPYIIGAGDNEVDNGAFSMRSG